MPSTENETIKWAIFLAIHLWGRSGRGHCRKLSANFRDIFCKLSTEFLHPFLAQWNVFLCKFSRIFRRNFPWASAEPNSHSDPKIRRRTKIGTIPRPFKGWKTPGCSVFFSDFFRFFFGFFFRFFFSVFFRVFSAKTRAFECKNTRFWVQKLTFLGAKTMASAPARCKNSENFTVFAPVFAQQWCKNSAKTVKISLFLHLVFVFLHLKSLFLHLKLWNFHLKMVKISLFLGAKTRFSGAKTPSFRCNFCMFWVQKWHVLSAILAWFGCKFLTLIC